MKYLENYGKIQEDWLVQITQDVQGVFQTLPYYLDEIRTSIDLPKDAINVVVNFQRTLNDGKIPNYQSFNKDRLFKKATITLNYSGETYYSILRFYDEKWHVSKQSLKVLKRYLTNINSIQSEKDEEDFVKLSEIIYAHLKNTKPKTNKHVPGYLYY